MDRDRDRIIKTYPPKTQEWLNKVREETDEILMKNPSYRKRKIHRSISQQTDQEREEFQRFMDKVFEV